MAQLKDLLVSGVSRFVGKLFANEVQLTTLNIPTQSNGSTYGPGTSGQVLATNNNSVYWKSLTIADIGGSTVLPVSLGGTGATVATKGGVVYGTGTTYGLTAAGTSGYLLQSGGTGAPTWINATNTNTASTIVKRDASGNFSAGTITATLSGNASTANALNFSHTNELFLGVNGTTQTRVWINYRRTINGAASGNTAITEYRFGNSNGGTSGVTLYADSFTGNAATASKLGTASAGSATQPIYWANGIPQSLTGTIANDISGNAATSTWTTLIKPIASTTTASASTWSIPTGSKQVWGERFSDSTLKYTPSGGSETTVTDTGDLVLFLTPSATSNLATLNMKIDGTYYGSFSGSLSGNASTASKANAANISTNTNGVAYYTNTSGAFGNIRSANGAFYSTETDVKPVFGTLPIAQGGTGKTTALDAITNLGGAYIKAQGTQITASSNLDTDYTTAGTYYAPDSTRSGSLAGTVVSTGSGFKMITMKGYREQNILQFANWNDERLLYRYSLDSTVNFGKWYQLVRLPSGSDKKTFAAVGGTVSPVYVDANGIIQKTSYNLNATVGAGTTNYMAYYNGANSIAATSSVRIIDGALNIYPANSSYREGIRIHPTGSWADITLQGNNNNANTSGISTEDWFIGNNNGNFYIVRNGSNSSATDATRSSFSSVGNQWRLRGYVQAHKEGIWRSGLHIYGPTYGNTAADMVSGTAGVFRWNDGGPQITFDTNATPGGGQAGALIFTDNDTAATGASFHFVTNQSDDNNGGSLTVTAPRFRARKGLTVGQNSDNTTYTLYVNGTGTINGGFGLAQTNGVGVGISLYGGAKTGIPEYGLLFAQTSNQGKWGDVQGDWATYFTMNTNSQRGWIWKSYGGTADANMAASLSSRGAFTARAVGANEGYIAFPQGGTYHTTSATVTGALKVVVPRYKTNSMISFDVNITTYDETTSNLVTYRIYGYEYGDSGWHGPVSKVVSWGKGDKINLSVRYCFDGTYPCITIGEVSTTWKYPQVSITNITCGYSDYLASSFEHGWSISFITTLPSTVVVKKDDANTNHINITGNAATSTKLGTSNVGGTYVPIHLAAGTATQCTSPSLQVNLASTNADTVFKQSPRPGVTGVLGATNGGTGKDNLKDACNALINALDTGSSTLTANDYVITQYVGGGTTTTTYHRRPASAIRVGGLLTGRSLKVALNSTTAVTFNGTADVNNIPVTGTLGIANGGTGQTSAANVFSALSWTDGTTAGPTLSATVVGQTRTATIPSASKTASGVVTTDAQTFKGNKIIEDGNWVVNITSASSGTSHSFGLVKYNGSSGTTVGRFAYGYSDTGGEVSLDLGNWVEGTAMGVINIYSNNGNYATLRTPSGRTTPRNGSSYYLPDFNGSGYLAHTASSSAVGGTTTPVYVSANGRILQCNSAASTAKRYILGASATSGALTMNCNSSVYTEGSVLFGAAWNDYAEYREVKENIEPGRVVIENGDDTLSLSTERMQPGAEIVSDTFGFAIGETEKCKTPIAATGRVLAYPNEPRETYKPGQPVCSGPNGTVSQMTNEEAREYPWLIIGTVSAIPDYDTWGEDNIKVNGRIWVRIR